MSQSLLSLFFIEHSFVRGTEPDALIINRDDCSGQRIRASVIRRRQCIVIAQVV